MCVIHLKIHNVFSSTNCKSPKTKLTWNDFMLILIQLNYIAFFVQLSYFTNSDTEFRISTLLFNLKIQFHFSNDKLKALWNNCYKWNSNRRRAICAHIHQNKMTKFRWQICRNDMHKTSKCSCFPEKRRKVTYICSRTFTGGMV